ncbi:glycosyltransferase [Nocardioides zeicaulis]|uniref:4,4'-diaponeurosporenoate glycosyltransferase n=1 Tax=Nocardioides zeicaulis TaxID=1776857 RepID=A0ABV6E4I9_9ACTN
MSRPAAVAVVVPARDEEELLPACLDAVAHAQEALGRAHPDVPTCTFVVLDACRDRTPAVVAARPSVVAVPSLAGNVGAARALGVEAAARWARATTDGPLWVAGTDADSVVPSHWLTAQVEMAAAGRDLVVGTVTPRRADLPPELHAAWVAAHDAGDGHPHVHGANLGFSLRAYEHVGGFAPLAVHEDVALVTAMHAAGLDVLATGAVAVTTSGRRSGRAPHGFAHYLDGLGA